MQEVVVFSMSALQLAVDPLEILVGHADRAPAPHLLRLVLIVIFHSVSQKKIV